MDETNDRRVEFDFEVDFTNGGGIQGQRFRLDLDGAADGIDDVDEIDDGALADAIVRDLRLLMVGEVRILNRRILRERHRRGRAGVVAAGGGGGTHGRTRLDLSHVVEDGMTTYPGLPGPRICDFLSREASRDVYAPGTEFQIGLIELCSNTGTYVDSPFHRFRDGADLSHLPLERLADLDAVVVDVTGSGVRAVDRAELLPYDLGGRAVLVRTAWDRHWRTDAYMTGHPYLTAAAAEHLVREGAALVGIDALNIDCTDGGERPVHTTLLGAGVPICEHLTGLGALPVEGFRFSAVPVKVQGMGTFPVRAYAVLE